MNSWFECILFHTHSQPETPAMVMEDRTVTYGMLGAAIERCARRIVALDIPPGGLVAVQIKNPIRDLTISLALFRIGLGSTRKLLPAGLCTPASSPASRCVA